MCDNTPTFSRSGNKVKRGEVLASKFIDYIYIFFIGEKLFKNNNNITIKKNLINIVSTDDPKQFCSVAGKFKMFYFNMAFDLMK